MMKMVNVLLSRRVRTLVHILLMLVTALFLISGLGITRYQLIGPLTLGILTKIRSFELHSALTWPFVILLALHMYITMNYKIRNWLSRIKPENKL
jgi:hypothetical protein